MHLAPHLLSQRKSSSSTDADGASQRCGAVMRIDNIGCYQSVAHPDYLSLRSYFPLWLTETIIRDTIEKANGKVIHLRGLFLIGIVEVRIVRSNWGQMSLRVF
jgi:hypothetical protein